MPEIRHVDGVDDVDEVVVSADEQFIDWLCADEDLLRAEFDAIIAAEWPGPPPAPPDRGTAAERGPRRTRHRAATRTAGLPSRPGHPDTGDRTRQRSPPPTASDNPRPERHVMAPA